MEAYLRQQDAERHREDEKRHPPVNSEKLEDRRSTEEYKRVKRKLEMQYN